MIKPIKKIGVFTSGGDAPGMNAAIRAVVRSSFYYGVQVAGINCGYQGMIEGDIIPELDIRSVNHILQKGGTILKSARCLEFHQKEGRAKAYQNLQNQGIDALVAIGGNGTFTGAKLLTEEFGIPVIGVPGTIDNDLHGTDFTIGFDTANNTVIHAVDNIRNTAQSHDRLFFVEVMGRDSGYIAAYTGLASGAVNILIPEKQTTINDIISKLEEGKKSNKSSHIIIVAEGFPLGSAEKVAALVKEKFDYLETKVTTLGHIQRGGVPSCFDRVLASRLGVAAVEALLNGKNLLMAGLINNKIAYTPLAEAIQFKDSVDEEVVRIAEILSI